MLNCVDSLVGIVKLEFGNYYATAQLEYLCIGSDQPLTINVLVRATTSAWAMKTGIDIGTS